MNLAAVQLSASAATLVAVAGGSGAFLGAVVGQVIQAVRDRLDRAHDETLARRGHQREAYVTLLGLAAEIEAAGTGVWLRAEAMFVLPIWDYSQQRWDESMKRFAAAAEQARPLSVAYGTGPVRDAFNVLAELGDQLARPPWEEINIGYYITARAHDGRLGLFPTKIGEDPAKDVKNIENMGHLAEQISKWTVERMRYELGVEDEAPAALPFALRFH